MRIFALLLVLGSSAPGADGERAGPLAAAPRPKARAERPRPKGKVKGFTSGPAINENKATPTSRIKTLDGFEVELLYSVPGDERGSWVNLCVDDRGRIIASDQFGGLYRFAAPAPGRPLDPADIEKVPAEIRAANGLLWAFGALYVGVNDYEDNERSGVYRVTDSDGDDTLDKVERLRSIYAHGDHGVHAILPAPDGKSLFLITGNGTHTTEYDASRVPEDWGEDHLLPRMPDGRGFMRDVLAPGGVVYRFSPDGDHWEVWSIGYRNIFDAAWNADGELFTYDADMEYDFNTPWYRPTRVCHVVSGSDFGWRNGAGKRPEWYPDTLPPVINIGPGSPTGMTFGYGAKFPARYQKALFILDWSWGKLYAVHLEPDGSSYTATKEEFLYGTPMPMTDVLIHPRDGAMYFAIGGRKVQSGLYRVTYSGSEPTVPVPARTGGQEVRDLRRRLEAFHGQPDPGAVAAAWPHLASQDRFLRAAARAAVEHQPPSEWADRALAEADPATQVEALMALTRATGIDPFHREESDPPVNVAMRDRILAALLRIDSRALDHQRRLTLVRTYQICLNRFGRPDEESVRRIIAQLDPLFPAASREMNQVLCETLVFLQAPTVAAKAIALLKEAPTQEEQMEYARSLRMLQAGWTKELHTDYFEWFLKAANYHGGASFVNFIKFIRDDAVASLSEAEKRELADVLARQPEVKSPLEANGAALAGRSVIKAWTLDELAGDAEAGTTNRNFGNGRKMFAAASCFTCHRFRNEGGMTGPDLTAAGRRYSPRDFLDQILNPNKEINEQFVPAVVSTLDGTVITGVIVNLKGDNVILNTDPSNPNQQVAVDRKEVESIEPSKISPMPAGLLGVLTKDEILDLVAYVLSGGDPDSPLFRKP